VLDERTWASVETPNKLFSCQHQIVTTVAVKGKGEWKVKLPVTVLPILLRHSDVIGNNDRLIGESIPDSFETSEAGCVASSLSVMYKTCHSLLQSPELRPPTNNDVLQNNNNSNSNNNDSNSNSNPLILLRIPPLNKM